MSDENWVMSDKWWQKKKKKKAITQKYETQKSHQLRVAAEDFRYP